MDKIVGKTLAVLTLVLFIVGQAQAGITLSAYDMDGGKLQQAGVGQPCMLEVVIDGAGRSTHRPDLEVPSSCIVQHVGLYLTTINGHSIVKHKYKVRIDAKGEYRLGPAKNSDNGQVSNVVLVKVGDEQIADRPVVQKKQQQGYAFLRLLADKKRAVVGERISCAVRFYTLDDTIALGTINEPEIKNITFSAKAGPTQGEQEIDGEQYHYQQWLWDAYATQPGSIVIPAYHADFEVQSPMGSLFSGFFRMSGEQKRVYSNALNLEIDPLPPYDKPVQAVGSFSAFSAHMEPAVAKEGEGMVLKLMLEGDGNLGAIKSMALQQVPETFKYYDSKNYLLDAKHGKCFEFIVQGLKSGNFEIPAQSFTYFDVDSRRYKTLHTMPLVVTVLPQPSNRAYTQPLSRVQPDVATAIALSDEAEIRPLNTQGSWIMREHRALPFWLFLLLVLLPIGAMAANVGLGWWQRYRTSNAPQLRRNKAFRQARSDLYVLMRTNNVAGVYKVFMQLFAARLGKAESEMCQEMIEASLQKANLSDYERQNWQQFFDRMAECVFFEKKIDKNARDAFFVSAREWIARLEKNI